MSLWLVRAGSHGEHEKKILDDKKLFLTWDNLNHDLSKLNSKDELRVLLHDIYPDFSKNKVINHSGQIWAFSHRIQKGDWIVLPSKHKPAIHIAEVNGDYSYDRNASDPYYHSLDVKWIQLDIPRTNFDQDILYSFGAFMTVCQIKRNDAEKRLIEMSKNDWKTTKIKKVDLSELSIDDDVSDEDGLADLEQIAQDQIARLIIAKFKGHKMARLVDGILQAEGYTTFVSPPGPDKGIDILAAPDALGFGKPRICVQVKSSDSPVDRPTLDQLIGSMANVQAEQGLLVSWGGFKSSVEKEEAAQFFKVRLWDRDDLIRHLLIQYNNLDDELKAELPLKRIWTVATSESEKG